MTFRPIPPIHTERDETAPWDGCWTMSLAMAVDAATGGAISLTDAGIRAAVGKPRIPGVSVGGTLEDQIAAIGQLAPSVHHTDWPSANLLRTHFNDGGGAVVNGNQHDAPRGQRQYDARFYDSLNAGHSIYVQGVAVDRVAWLDPLMPAGATPAVYTWDELFKYCWANGNGLIYAIMVDPAAAAAPTIEPFPAPQSFSIGPGVFTSRLIGGGAGHTSSFDRPSSALADAFVTIGTTRFIRVTNGTYAGELLPLTSVTLYPSPAPVPAPAPAPAPVPITSDQLAAAQADAAAARAELAAVNSKMALVQADADAARSAAAVARVEASTATDQLRITSQALDVARGRLVAARTARDARNQADAALNAAIN